MTEKKKRQSKYPPYDQAKAMALELQLNSRSAYHKWHSQTKCEYLPAYPERVYKSWVSWNDYLGTANIFKGEVIKAMRPFWDAVKYAQGIATTHNLNTMVDWIEYWKAHMEELPEDIPLRPDQRYIEWQQISWKGWLGTDARQRLIAAKHSTALFAICSNHNQRKPGNVYACLQAENGEAELLSMLQRARDLVCVRIYKLPNECKEQVMETVKRFTPKNQQGSYEGVLIPQISDLLFELDMMLITHHMKPIEHKAIEVDVDGFMFPDHVYRHRIG